MRVGIIGANGQLGADLVKAFIGHEVTAWTRNDFDVRDRKRVLATVIDTNPHIVVNTAAFHNTDACEGNASLAFEVNAVGSRNVAQACQACGGLLVHISTDYVFDGQKTEPYTEDDRPNPLNVYGTSKLAGEHLSASICARYYIIRVSALFGTTGGSSKINFVERMLSKANAGETLTIVDDLVTSPTYTVDAASTIRGLIEAEVPSGTYHVTNAGACSWYRFAETILQEAGITADLRPTTIAALNPKARRPKYTALTSAKLGASGLSQLRSWRDALVEYLSVKRDEVLA